MTRGQWQDLALIRLKDAEELLKIERWALAYYVTGYVIECGLKACLLKYVGDSDAIFHEDNGQKYLKGLSDCWTHDFVKLIKLAGLDAEFGQEKASNSLRATNWVIVKDWKESSRYKSRTELEARALYEAVSNDPDGILTWIRRRW